MFRQACCTYTIVASGRLGRTLPAVLGMHPYSTMSDALCHATTSANCSEWVHGEMHRTGCELSVQVYRFIRCSLSQTERQQHNNNIKPNDSGF